MMNENEKLPSPEEEYEAAKLRLALHSLLCEEYEAVRSGASAEDEAEAARLAEADTPRMLGFIDRRFRARRAPEGFRAKAANVLKIAAAVVLLCNMGLTVAAASNTGVRAMVLRFLISANDSYAEIGFETCDESVMIPEGWVENYFPTYIPEGYEQVYCRSDDSVSTLEYENREGKQLFITFYGAYASCDLNMENTEISYTPLHGTSAMVVKQPFEEVDIIWNSGDRIFMVEGCDYETAYTVADSIMVITK